MTLLIVISGIAYTGDRDVPDFQNDAQYQQLEKQAIVDYRAFKWRRIRKKTLRRWKERYPKHEFFYNAVNNSIGPHVLGNGDWALYSPESGAEWRLKKGDTVSVKIFLDLDKLMPQSPERREFRKQLLFGYVKRRRTAVTIFICSAQVPMR